jgi:hypothetical protein
MPIAISSATMAKHSDVALSAIVSHQPALSHPCNLSGSGASALKSHDLSYALLSKLLRLSRFAKEIVEMQPGLVPIAKRQHKKSRTGCKNCKLRKVKVSPLSDIPNKMVSLRGRSAMRSILYAGIVQSTSQMLIDAITIIL